jgi:hypothetical protein
MSSGWQQFGTLAKTPLQAPTEKCLILEGGARNVSHVFKKSKDRKSKRIRKEKQEYPNNPLGEAFMDKMKEGAGD